MQVRWYINNFVVFWRNLLKNKFNDEGLQSNFWLLTQCLSELPEYISPDYKSRAYELLVLNFSARDIKLLDEYLLECLKTDVIPTRTVFREKIIEITNGLTFNEESAERLLLAYQNEELF